MGDAASKICETTGGAAAPEMDWVDISDPNVRTTAGVVMPRLIYGTAWKETKVGPGATARLVVEAVRAGFTGIDSACQPKHYHEPGVGVGLKQLFSEGLRREQLFIQTKFSRNQDPDTVPYDSKASVPAQVAESVCELLQGSQINVAARAAVHLYSTRCLYGAMFSHFSFEPRSRICGLSCPTLTVLNTQRHHESMAGDGNRCRSGVCAPAWG